MQCISCTRNLFLRKWWIVDPFCLSKKRILIENYNRIVTNDWSLYIFPHHIFPLRNMIAEFLDANKDPNELWCIFTWMIAISIKATNLKHSLHSTEWDIKFECRMMVVWSIDGFIHLMELFYIIIVMNKQDWELI